MSSIERKLITTKMHPILIVSLLSIANGLQQHEVIVNNTTIIPEHDKCEQITARLCIDLPYNMTIMPNLLGHSTQEEAGLEVHQFSPLIEIKCSTELQLFLCSAYFPKCTILGKPVPPCKNLCLAAKDGCEGIMLKYGFSWPENLDCDGYSENSAVCVKKHNITVIPTPQTANTTKEQPDFTTVIPTTETENTTKHQLDFVTVTSTTETANTTII